MSAVGGGLEDGESAMYLVYMVCGVKLSRVLFTRALSLGQCLRKSQQ